MVKRISFFVAMFTVCIFAQNTAETTPAVQPAPVVQTEPVAAEAAPAVETETVQTEQVATETATAAPVVAPAPPAPAATGSTKEAIIESPIEFAIVSAVFIATVLLITLTGN